MDPPNGNHDLTGEQESSSSFSIKFSFKGNSITVPNLTNLTTSGELLELVRKDFFEDSEDEVLVKLLFKGKIIAQEFLQQDEESSTRNIGNDNMYDQPAFPKGLSIPKSGALKVIIMVTEAKGVRKLNSGRSDPLVRGFDDISVTNKAALKTSFWGPIHGKQYPQYKFCRLQECTDASFGSRPLSTTPHAFEARRLLERLSTDPGITAILKSRELLVGTLGELDPIDDRLMKQKREEGACLLGYNTNHGMRIDVKLRSDDLSAFRPYHELCATLIHELSHNWVSEHDVLFWTNYGQMRVEYLWHHACLLFGGEFVGGKRTATLAGVMDMILPNNGAIVSGGRRKGPKQTLDPSQMMENICQSVFKELEKEMAQHHIPSQMVAPAIIDFSKDLILENKHNAANLNNNMGGQRLGGGAAAVESDGTTENSARERALAAAEKRAREAKKKMEE